MSFDPADMLFELESEEDTTTSQSSQQPETQVKGKTQEKDTKEKDVKPEFVIQKTPLKRPYTGLIYGSPGVGKTTLCASIPNAIVIDLENGADGINCHRISIKEASHPTETINSIKRAIAFAIQSGYTTVILDSLTSLASLFEKEFLISSGKTTLDSGNYGQDYNAVNDLIKEFLGGQTAKSGVMNYLATRGCNLILVGHEKEKVEQIGDSKLLHSTVPNFFKGLVTWLSIQMDFIFFYTYDIIVKEEKLGMAKSTLSATRGRKILTSQEGGIMAKNRYGLKPSLSNPTSELFTSLFDPSNPA